MRFYISNLLESFLEETETLHNNNYNLEPKFPHLFTIYNVKRFVVGRISEMAIKVVFIDIKNCLACS